MSCCAVSSESLVAKHANAGKGKVALVTGANTGIGKLTARSLAAVGFHVVIAGRSISSLEAAKKEIYQSTGLKDEGDGGRVTILKTTLDLSSVASVKAYSADFHEQKLGLHVLVNNAGVANFPGKTKEGLDYTMGVNWYGGFLLTNLLLDVIKASAPSRIVIVASTLESRGRISAEGIDKLLFPGDGPNVSSLGYYQQVYSDSKLANVLHARSLAKRMEGSNVSVFSLHPGVVRTEFVRNLNCCLRCCFACLSCCLRSPSQGASTSVYCSVVDGMEKESGGYFKDCRLSKASNPAAHDDKICEALWEKGEELTKKYAS